MFYRLFLSDVCLGKACYDKCKYKYDKSAADIRIGDLWGKTYSKEDKGVSCAIAFTERGNDVLKQCDTQLVTHKFEVVAEGQMKENAHKNKQREVILSKLQCKQNDIMSFKKVLNKIALTRNFNSLLKHPRSSMIGILKIIFTK